MEGAEGRGGKGDHLETMGLIKMGEACWGNHPSQN